ncbi:MAG TPA: ATP-binding protein [Ktedonobacteraceae bacterium]|nr:ATP-binding protein [Ktedonobacteraceae bacterium]
MNIQSNLLTDEEPVCLGLVGSPQGQEATSRQYYFWVARDVLVEETQLVVCRCTIAGRDYTFHGVIDEVHRRSRKRSMDEEFDQSDGDVDYVPPFESDGYTYAQVSILSVEPSALTPPCERSKVYLAQPNEAATAYGADEIQEGNALSAGLIKNGGNQFAGPGMIDLDYLLGVNGGHLNVNGSAGRGTKSSLLLFLIWMLITQARQQAELLPLSTRRRRIVPIVLNVKNFDLFYIDYPSRRYDPQIHLANWQRLGIEQPAPFQSVSFFAPQQPGNTLPVATGRDEGVMPYSWGLQDIIEQGLFRYLFSDDDANDANFSALALAIEDFLTTERRLDNGDVIRSLDPNAPSTFQNLEAWIKEQMASTTPAFAGHHSSTWKKFWRRLFRLIYESSGVLRRNEAQGQPLNVTRGDTSDPIVVDLFSLAAMPEMQRFVVATILRQLIEARTGTRAIRGLVYTVVLDELNRFAPKGARDPITQLIEMVAAEMRSQGIILLGAQQQASRVSEKVIENAAIRALGQTGSLELGMPIWKFLSTSARERAMNLRPDEKLMIQATFRQPMLVSIPFPVWAMNPDEAILPTADNQEDDYSDLINE